MIFAEPNTITGSIGIFGILPTFENALAKIGVTSRRRADDAAVSGQPDVYPRASTPQLDAVLQAAIEDGYRALHRPGRQARAR